MEMEIVELEIENGEDVGAEVSNFKDFPEKVKRKTGKIWTDERSKQQRERTKKYWYAGKEKLKSHKKLFNVFLINHN